MKKVCSFGVVAGIILSACAGLVFAGKGNDRQEDYASGHVLVKFREAEVLERVPDYARKGMRGVEGRLGLPPGIRVRETQFAKWRKRKHGEAEDAAEDMSVFMYIDLPPGLSEDDAVAVLSGNPMIEYAEKDALGAAGATVPTNDPLYSLQWQYRQTDRARVWTPEAWDFTQGSSNVTVAILDTGVNTNIFEFRGRTVPGWDFVNGDSDPNDDNNHGTAVASLLGASANDGYRMVGVDWHCRLMPLKILDNNATGQLSWWAQATYWAVTNGADVINLSAGSWTTNTTLEDAIRYAVSNGVTYVTITHNDGTNEVRFPGSMDETITVGGITRTGTHWTASNTGTNTDLVAPCTNLTALLTLPVAGAWTTNAVGTSFAAPMVSGAASLLLSLDPTLDCWKVRDLLCGGADDRSSSDTNDVAGWDTHFGWGKLNVYNSIRLLLTEIDTISTSGVSGVYLSWPCTQNAQSNQPYGVLWANDFTSTNWTYVTNVTYTSQRAHWTGGTGGSKERWYRTFVKRYQSWTND